jgi:pimeloyl-ACP methyl ester carboxylesterase
MTRILFILFLLSFSYVSWASGQTLLQPCDVAGIAGKAQCGSLEVFENRATRAGRKITLKVLVLPAKGANRAPDPLFYIPGGPGSSAIEDAPGLASLFAKIHERRDLVFLDQRGTGGSHPLNCKLFNPADPQSYFGYFFPLADVKQCRKELEADADLTLYTTPVAMDDLEEVRGALGYDKINIFGGSYGTRAALVYLRQHPAHVRTILLQGVAPTNQFMPYDFPQGTERALQGVITECANDVACHSAFPTLPADEKTVLERLLQGPVEVDLPSPNPSGTANPPPASNSSKVTLSRDLAAEAIRYMLYNPVATGRVPLVLHQAASGNYVPLAQNALFYRRQLVASGSNGLYLSITCAEDLPWIKPGEGERLAANTFLGDYRLRQQREACALWPKAKIPAEYSKPVSGSAPVLILTGQWDPVTPPANADNTARYLPNSLHLVVPHGAHGLGGLEGIECVDKLLTQFVEDGTTKNLNLDCVKNIRRKGFAVK